MELKEICAKYGESLDTLTRYCRSGVLPAVKIRNRWNVTVSDFEEWKAKRERGKVKRINTRQCKQCEYGMMVSSAEYGCDYMAQTGMMRNCPTYPTCEKFKPKSKRHSRKSAEGM